MIPLTVSSPDLGIVGHSVKMIISKMKLLTSIGVCPVLFCRGVMFWQLRRSRYHDENGAVVSRLVG